MTEISEEDETWKSGDEKDHECVAFDLHFPAAPLHLPLKWVNAGLSRHGQNFNGYLGFQALEGIPEGYANRLEKDFGGKFEYCDHGIDGYVLDSGKDKERIFTVATQENMALLIMGANGSRPRKIVRGDEPISIEDFAEHMKQFQEYGNIVLNAFYGPQSPNNTVYLSPVSQ